VIQSVHQVRKIAETPVDPTEEHNIARPEDRIQLLAGRAVDQLLLPGGFYLFAENATESQVWLHARLDELDVSADGLLLVIQTATAGNIVVMAGANVPPAARVLRLSNSIERLGDNFVDAFRDISMQRLVLLPQRLHLRQPAGSIKIWCHQEARVFRRLNRLGTQSVFPLSSERVWSAQLYAPTNHYRAGARNR